MKELDKAILNSDITRIEFLFGEEIDFTAAVLLHLKEALPIEEAQLTSRGAILTMESLKSAMQKYLKGSPYRYNQETYVKRVHLGLQAALKAWQTGKMANTTLSGSWDSQALETLQMQWKNGSLPEGLSVYALDKQASYIELSYQQWQSGAIESEEIDALVKEALLEHWRSGIDDKLTVEIRENLSSQLLDYYRASSGKFVQAMQSHIYKRTVAKISDGSINDLLVKDVIVQEKERILQGAIKPNSMVEYKKAVKNVLLNWQQGALEVSDNEDVTDYIKSQLEDYEVPQECLEALADKAIEALLEEYQQGQLGSTLQGLLQERFSARIQAYYESSVKEDTAYRAELVNCIFTQLLTDWQAGRLDVESSEYLQENLLEDVQDILRKLSLSTSCLAMAAQVKDLQTQMSLVKSQLQLVLEQLAIIRSNVAVDAGPADIVYVECASERAAQMKPREASRSAQSSAESLVQAGMFRTAADKETGEEKQSAIFPIM